MNTLQIVLFTAILTAISLGLHVYVASRLLAGADLSPRGRRIAWGAALTSGLALPWIFRLMTRAGEGWADGLAYVGWVLLGAFSILFALLLAVDVALLIGRIGARLVGRRLLPEDPGRRRFLRRVLNLGVVGATALLSGVGVVQARRRAAIKRVTIPIEGLPAALHGFKIAQISDLHVGPTIRGDDMRAVTEAVNELGADLVAVTGDLVDGSVERLAPHVAPLGELRSRHGTFFVTGNHDYFSGALAWMKHCAEALGWEVLGNRHTVVEHDGARIVVAGVHDLTSHRFVDDHISDPKAAIAGAPAADLRVLLAHQPKSILDAAGLGFHLQLSGHTHGGQYFPFTRILRAVLRFTTGLTRVDDTWLYINAGTTYWGPPMRLDSAQEITLVELAAA
ncbi:MAG: metallophosphoesterase [Nannocystaceae bacterium]